MEYQPNIYESIGHCSLDDCPSYDGKRCKLLGFRPDGICEPWVKDIKSQLTALQEERDRYKETLERLQSGAYGDAMDLYDIVTKALEKNSP